MSIHGSDITYSFEFTAKNKQGEYYFNRYMKTHPSFVEVEKTENFYKGYARLGDLLKLSCSSLWKYGKLEVGQISWQRTVIECNPAINKTKY